jgi:hypothetical protein
MDSITAVTRVLGWCPLWSNDRLTIVQVFTDNKGLIRRVTVNQRKHKTALWGPTTEVFEDCEN